MNYTPYPLTLRQLQYIIAVATQKSFRKAAEACHVSQPSLSAQIAQVEQVLGVQLFERNRRKVMLTSAGQIFVERARTVLTMMGELIDSALDLADPFSGPLKIGLIPTIGPYLLPEIAPVLRGQYPKLNFIWTEEKTAILIQQLVHGELDAAIMALVADISEFPYTVLGKDAFVFASANQHPLAVSKRTIRPEELEGELVLLLEDGHCFREQALSFCTKMAAEEADYRATSLPTLVQMVAGNAGVTLLPSLALAVENRRKTLHIRTFAPKAPSRTIILVWRKNSALETVIKAMGETLRVSYARLKPLANK